MVASVSAKKNVKLKVNKAETAVVVDEHGGALVALLGEFPF